MNHNVDKDTIKVLMSLVPYYHKALEKFGKKDIDIAFKFGNDEPFELGPLGAEILTDALMMLVCLGCGKTSNFIIKETIKERPSLIKNKVKKFVKNSEKAMQEMGFIKLIGDGKYSFTDKGNQFLGIENE